MSETFAFNLKNYQFLLVGIVFLIFGFTLLSGGNGEHNAVFNEAIFCFRRITLAPSVLILAYGIVLYAIVQKPKPE